MPDKSLVPEAPKPLTEKEFRIIAERAFNLLIPMDPATREDMQRLIGFTGVLRKMVGAMDAQIRGATDTMLVICSRAPDQTISVADDDIMALDPKDALHVEDVADKETGRNTKIFRFLPATRIIQ